MNRLKTFRAVNKVRSHAQWVAVGAMSLHPPAPKRITDAKHRETDLPAQDLSRNVLVVLSAMKT